MYYSKYDYYFMVFGCVCLLTFIAFVFNIPQKLIGKNTDATTEQVIDNKMLKESLDELSQKLEKIRELMQKQEAREKERK